MSKGQLNHALSTLGKINILVNEYSKRKYSLYWGNIFNLSDSEWKLENIYKAFIVLPKEKVDGLFVSLPFSLCCRPDQQCDGNCCKCWCVYIHEVYEKGGDEHD